MNFSSVWWYAEKNMPKFLVSGNARSKKAAKRVAAQAMLTHIKGLVDENSGESAQLEEEDEDIPLVSRTALQGFSNFSIGPIEGKILA